MFFCLQSFAEHKDLNLYGENSIQNITHRINGYNIRRDLEEYERIFGELPEYLQIEKQVEQLRGGVIYDAGAGKARTLIGLLNKYSSQLNAVVAYSLKKPSYAKEINQAKRNNYFKFVYVEDFFENETGARGLIRRQLKKRNRGNVDIAFDVMGAFTYTEDTAAVLDKHMELLKPGGLLYLTYVKTNKGNSTLMFKSKTGQTISTANFFAQFPEFEVLHSGDYSVRDEEQVGIVLRRTEEASEQRPALIESFDGDSVPPIKVIQIQ